MVSLATAVHDVQYAFEESFITATYCKFIMWIGQQAPSLGLVVFLLLVTTHIYKHGDYEPCCPFHVAQYWPDLLHEWHQLPLEFITPKALIHKTPVSYSHWFRLVAAVKGCWKEINTWAIIWGNKVPTVYLEFLRHVYSQLSMELGFSWLKFLGWRLSKRFCTFRTLLQGYVWRIYATNLSEIDKAPYQIVYHSRSNPPRPPCGMSWESVLSPVGQSKWTDDITMPY